MAKPLDFQGLLRFFEKDAKNGQDAENSVKKAFSKKSFDEIFTAGQIISPTLIIQISRQCPSGCFVFSTAHPH